MALSSKRVHLARLAFSPRSVRQSIGPKLQRASLATWSPPPFENEPVKDYAKGSPERDAIIKALKDIKKSFPAKIPITIGGKVVNDKLTLTQVNPSNFKEVVANYASATPEEVNRSIDAALKAKTAWADLPFQERAAVFLRAADLIAGKYRAEINAATMLGQGKNVFQAEVDAAVETPDFLRFYIKQIYTLYATQPQMHAPGSYNKQLYRPLEGFIYAIAPFNFTALFGTLVAPASLLGNVVIWKPSPSALHASWILYQILLEAGLPKDVIQFLPGDAVEITDTILQRAELAGISYIGSTAVFKEILGKVGKATGAGTFKSYPRVVGETGGKNFHLIHSSADVRSAALNTIRATFEYQGQKCSACSRAYVSESVWPEFQRILVEETKKLKVGGPEQFENFVNPVIHGRAFDRLKKVFEDAKSDSGLTLLAGGDTDGSKGYFVQPTIYQTSDPNHEIMNTELFGPVLSIYVYPDAEYDSIPALIDSTSSYALTGSIFAKDPIASHHAQQGLMNTAGNLYLNTKCTGSIVGQQPFGGSRDSGTNDKTGSLNMLSRWVSVQTIKEEYGLLDTPTYPSNEI